jgi:formylglycine-generating enzyme required for sulfatase activity
MVRGGSWVSGPDALRSAKRLGGYYTATRTHDLGFRLAQDVE